MTSQITIITGANRGYGKAIAHSLIEHYSKDSDIKHHILLVGRNERGLEKVKQELENGINSQSAIYTFSNIEFSEVDTLAEKLEPLSNKIKELATSEIINNNSSKKLWLFNNHGSLGDVTKSGCEFNALEIQEYTAINFTSFSYLSTLFATWSKYSNFEEKIMINTSSLAAIVPIPSSSFYCAIKAARDMLYKVIAVEEKENIKTLNYAPGPMEGDMQVEIRSKLKHEETRKSFQNLQDEGKLVNMGDSADKLIKLLHKNEFESGAHIDFYDV